MSTVADRLMLKDRIIENISTSIKQIQELQCIDKEEGDEIVLTNESWQVHRLCEHLDHAFLYGLRHVSKGYWVMLKEFTHKEDLRMILSLPHIATDIGRGRAWMYVVLNENNMESYIRSFMDNRHVLRRHYVKHALLLDEQRMQVLLTLVAGLEFITFSVDPDVPYLDLQASCFISVPRSKRSESCVSCDVEDAVSICSMESEVSQVSGKDVCTAEIPDSDYASLIDSSTHSSLAGKDRSSPRHSPNGVKQDDKVKLADSKEHVTERALHSKEEGIIPDADEANDIIQVIQDNPAVGDHGNHEPSSEQTSDAKQTDVPAPASCDDNPASTREAATRDGAKEASVTRRASAPRRERPKSCTMSARASLQQPRKRHSGGVEHFSRNLAVSVDVPRGLSDLMALPGGRDPKLIMSHVRSGRTMRGADAGRGRASLRRSSPRPPTNCHRRPHEGSTVADDVSSECDAPPVSGCARQEERKVAPANGSPEGTLPEEEAAAAAVALADMSVSLTSFAGPDADVQRMLMEGSSDEVALYDRRVDEPASCDSDGVEAPPACDPGRREECAEDTSDVESADDTVCDSDDEESSSSDDGAVTVPRSLSMVAPSAKRLRVGALHESDLWLDNNTLLSLMVDIIEFENEQFYKLFRASSNHTEGEILVIYLMLTNRCLYFLRQSSEPGKFYKDAVMQYKELDYVSLSMNYQTLTLVCRNERRQFCVCTADENLTRAVVSSLEIAIRRSPHVKHLPNVLTDATAQKGALRKWVAKECGCESSKVALKHYALIHWENLDAFLGTHSKTTDCEGQLMFLDTADYLSGPIWKTGYFVLKNGWLYQYQEQYDKLPNVCLQINGPDMGGCRRCPQSDVPNTFELVSSDGSTLKLAASDEHAASTWMHSFLEIVAQGVKDEQLQTVVPCAAVLTRDRLMMCHEELQTGFVRSLGGAILHDLASISVDPPCKDYCVLVFEYSDDEDAEDALTYMETMEAAEMHSLGGHTHNTHWVLYFTSEWEQYKFVQSLGNTWTEIFQVDMPINEVKAGKLRNRCRDEVRKIREMLSGPIATPS